VRHARIVQRDFHDRFVDALARYTQKVKTGDPLDPRPR
jgi:acyl-CoA reductase-like NAD-dependent aldehyde dehydrogenase